MIGKTIHHYQFLEKLGAGGMGEIWKAQDTRLNRFVAVKVLTSASAGDPERRRRFFPSSDTSHSCRRRFNRKTPRHALQRMCCDDWQSALLYT